MQNDTLYLQEKPQLRMAEDKTTFRRPLTDWPPQVEYEVPQLREEPKKWPSVVATLLLIGAVTFLYFQLR